MSVTSIFLLKNLATPARHRRASALALGSLPKLTLPTKLRARFKTGNYFILIFIYCKPHNMLHKFFCIRAHSF